MSNTIYSTNLLVENESYNNITKKYNYVYLITEISTNRKYIGVRSCDINIYDDLGKQYISSSSDKDFISRQKEKPLDYSYTILSNYNSRIDANSEEIRLHELYNVDINPEYINRIKSTHKGFDATGKTVVKDEHGNILQVAVNDERYLSGDLVGINKNKICAKDNNGNIVQVNKDDIQYLSGELVGINKNKTVINDNGTYKSISNDEFYEGNYKGVTIGRVVVKDTDGNILQVSVDDPKYLSGELVHVNKNRRHTDESKRKMSDQNTGSNNGFYGKNHSKKTLLELSNIYNINGEIFIGRNDIAKKYECSIRTVLNRCKSDNFPDWKIIEKEIK